MQSNVQSNYTNTKLKAWFKRVICHPARKRSGPILHPRTHTGKDRELASIDVVLGVMSSCRISVAEDDVMKPVGNDTLDVHQVTNRLKHRLEIVLLRLPT